MTTTTLLLLYLADREQKNFIYNRGGVDRSSSLYVELYKLDEKISGRDTRKWCFVFEKHGTVYKKCKNLQPVKDVVDVFDNGSDDEVYENSTVDSEYSRSITKEYTDEIFKRKYINSNKL